MKNTLLHMKLNSAVSVFAVAAAEKPPNPLTAEFPVINAEQLIIANIHLAMPPKQQHHVPAAHLTPDKAAIA